MVDNKTAKVKKKGTWGGARPNSGGARPGAGRKSLGGKMRSLRMTDFEYDFVRWMLKELRAGTTVFDTEKYKADWMPKEQ